MAERKALEPQITVKSGDTEQIVKVGPLSWAGVKDFLDVLSSANLPLPNLASGAISEWLETSRKQLGEINLNESLEIAAAKLSISQQQTNLGMYRVISDLLSENMQVIYQWILKHPPVVAALVKGATGLKDEHLDSLSAGEFVRVARASLNALSEDGLWEGVAGFFGDWLPKMTGATSEAATEISPSDEPEATAESANESKSESAPSQAGA